MTARLHIGNGAIYLENWVNIDIPGPYTFLASNRPDLVAKWKTTEDDYYGKNKDKSVDSFRKGPLHQETVCDIYGSFDNIPAAYWSVSEVLTRNVFEHLSIKEARKALDQVDAIMEPNGILRIDVPDHEETLRLYHDTGDKFYVRHLLGPRNSEYGYHLVGYTRDRLRALVEDHGFVFECEEDFEHLYPSICLRFRKPGPRAPRDYVKLPDIPDDWKVLDIGPGEYPLPRADVYLDYDIDKLTPLSKHGKSTILGDIMTKLERIPDKHFDFVWCSHAMEHLTDPAAAAATISRIGKRGCMVVPSAMKEGLFAHEERGHLWLCLPGPCECSPAVFVRSDPKYIDPLRDPEVQKISGRLWRTGPNRQEEARYLRKWFYEKESALDVVVHWEGELKVQVIG
jgi:SAM-dependent methyltransferase